MHFFKPSVASDDKVYDGAELPLIRLNASCVYDDTDAPKVKWVVKWAVKWAVK